MEVKFPGEFKSCEFICSGLFGEIHEHFRDDDSVVTQTFEGAFDVLLLREIQDVRLVRVRDAYRVALQGITVNEDLCDASNLQITVLYLLRRDVLALLQLEDVLLPIDDLQSFVVRENCADVACV